MKLSDEDRAAIAAAWIGVAWGNAGGRAIQAAAEDTYLAGLRSGLERAAKVCDELLDRQLADEMDGSEFSAAIRALPSHEGGT